MLRLMRDYAGSWMIKIILGAIVVVFVFWGVGSFRNRKANLIASVNGEPITFEEYQSTYNMLLEQMRQRLGDNLNEELLKMLRIDQQAMDQLVDQRLLLQEAAKLKLRVTDDEVVESIQHMNVFHRNGQFDSRLYTTVLNFNRMTPEQFEKAQKDQMLIEKLRSYFFGNFQVSDNELLEFFNWRNTSVAIDYILFDPKIYQDIKLSGEDLETYFNDHKEKYRTEPQLRAQYIRFAPEDYKESFSIPDEDIEAYYEDYKTKFETPKTVEARHILIRVSPDAPVEAVDAAKAKAEEILEMVRKGEDFTALAKKYSDGPSKKDGGYLGTIKKEDMVPPFAEKAFSMKAGEVSEPVKTQLGWHLIKVEKVNEASVQSFEDAKDTIRDNLTDEEAKAIAYDKADAFYGGTLEGDDIAVIGQEMDLNVQKTGLFTASGPEKGIKNRAGFAKAAFELSLNQISDIQDLGDGYYIVQVVETIPGKIPGLGAIEEELRKDVLNEKQTEKAKEEATALLLSLKNKGDEALKADGKAFSFKTTDYFKRNEQIPDIGREFEISKAAFNLTLTQPYPEDVFGGGNGFYVIRLKDRRLPDLEEFDKEKKALKENLLSQKKTMAFNEWLANVRKTSDISIAEGFETASSR